MASPLARVGERGTGRGSAVAEALSTLIGTMRRQKEIQMDQQFQAGQQQQRFTQERELTSQRGQQDIETERFRQTGGLSPEQVNEINSRNAEAARASGLVPKGIEQNGLILWGRPDTDPLLGQVIEGGPQVPPPEFFQPPGAPQGTPQQAPTPAPQPQPQPQQPFNGGGGSLSTPTPQGQGLAQGPTPPSMGGPSVSSVQPAVLPMQGPTPPQPAAPTPAPQRPVATPPARSRVSQATAQATTAAGEGSLVERGRVSLQEMGLRRVSPNPFGAKEGEVPVADFNKILNQDIFPQLSNTELRNLLTALEEERKGDPNATTTLDTHGLIVTNSLLATMVRNELRKSGRVGKK